MGLLWVPGWRENFSSPFHHHFLRNSRKQGADTVSSYTIAPVGSGRFLRKRMKKATPCSQFPVRQRARDSTHTAIEVFIPIFKLSPHTK